MKRKVAEWFFRFLLIAGGIVALMVALATNDLSMFFVVVAFATVYHFGFHGDEFAKVYRSSIDEIDDLDGVEFERRLARLFSDLGYRVQLTKRTGDFGADLIIIKDGLRTAVQAKRYKGNVGVDAINEIVGGRLHWNCECAMVVTNSYFTKPAQEHARRCQVILWDRDRLIEEIAQVNKETEERRTECFWERLIRNLSLY